MVRKSLRSLGLSLGGTVLLASSFVIVACTVQNREESTAGIVHMCSSCHGIEGRSVSPTFPRLAGQKKDYLIAQLTAFHDHTRADQNARTYMWGMAAHLVDASHRENVAAYFSSQTPVAGTPGDSHDTAAGRKIYEDGMLDRGVAACAGCHGDHGQGLDGAPRLAGQHPGYIERRMAAFGSEAYVNGTIHRSEKALTEDQARQVATYLAFE